MRLEGELERALDAFHEAEPLRPGMPGGTLRGALPDNVAAPVAENVRIGLGAQGFVITESIAGFSFVNATFGTADRHVTIAAGGALEFTTGDVGLAAMTIGGSRRRSHWAA